MTSSTVLTTALPSPVPPEPETAHPGDAASHRGLRRALQAVEQTGWDSPAGHAVMDAIQDRAASWAFLVDRRCGRRPGSTDPADVVSAAWLTLARVAGRVAEAQHPWAYLWTAVGNELARSAVADAQLGDPARARFTAPTPTAVVRVGLEADVLDAAAHGPLVAASRPTDAPPSAPVVELAHRLAVQPSDIAYWLDAIDRALEVMADARRSYEECRLRRDPYLRGTLGLTIDELGALGALLIGPRRGDRAAQSLLLALHRDIDVATESVVGAQARVAVLRAARRNAAVERSVA